MVRYLLLAGMLAIFSGCTKHPEFVPVYDVPVELQPIVDAFINEAAKRGHVFKKENLLIKYDSAADGALCASCNSMSTTDHIQKIIAIYKANPCWLNDAELETLIFHELGHCFLGRGHEPALLPNGDPKSIMNPGNLSIYSPCIYALGGNQPCDNTFKRSYYIDELFDENTPVPSWGR